MFIQFLFLGVQNDNKIAFIHIPKTGGETIEKLFNLSKNHHSVSKRFSKGIPKIFLCFQSFVIHTQEFSVGLNSAFTDGIKCCLIHMIYVV